MKKDVHVRVRMPAELREAIEARAAADAEAPPFSAMLRTLVRAGLAKRPVVTVDREALIALAGQLRGLGVNLNQLARQAHLRDERPGFDWRQFEHTAAEITRLARQARDVVEKLADA